MAEPTSEYRTYGSVSQETLHPKNGSQKVNNKENYSFLGVVWEAIANFFAALGHAIASCFSTLFCLEASNPEKEPLKNGPIQGDPPTKPIKRIKLVVETPKEEKHENGGPLVERKFENPKPINIDEMLDLCIGQATKPGESRSMLGAPKVQIQNPQVPRSMLGKEDPKVRLAQLMPKPKLAIVPGKYADCKQVFRQYQGFDMKDKGAFKAFIAQDPDCPFRQQLARAVENAHQDMGIEETILNEKNLQVPDAAAMEHHAEYLFHKYSIVIRVADAGRLKNVLEELNQKITFPVYLGIVATNYNLSSHKTAHVTPLLFYFPGNGKKEDIQCIILDSVGQPKQRDTLEKFGVLNKNIYVSSPTRQADHYSCHTDALVTLRNSLLSLILHQRHDGFSDALREAKVDRQNKNNIRFLPPEWDFTSQIRNKNLKLYTLDPRSCFSKQPKKPMQTAKKHRDKHTRNITTKENIWKNGGFDGIDAPAPDGVNVTNNGYFSMSFEQERAVDAYLAEKGRKLAERRKSN